MTLKEKYRRWIILFVLSIGGGAIYLLPYLRYPYYDSLITAFGFTNTQLGVLMSIYGITNIFSYFIGGLLADNFQARYLITFSLIGTGLLGFYYATFPDFTGAVVVHCLWSVTTIMTFWAPLIKSIRLLGNDSIQGRLFGFKDTGFAVFALAYSSIALQFFNSADEFGGVLGLKNVILIYSTTLIVSGICSYFFIPLHNDYTGKQVENGTSPSKKNWKMLGRPELWLAASIIFCAYSIHTGIAFTIPYATNAFGISIALGASLGIIRTYGVQLIGCPIGGFIVDGIRSSTKFLSSAFGFVIVLIVGFIAIPAVPDLVLTMMTLMMLVAICLSAMRAVYFVPLAELKIRDKDLGLATGLMSVIGFLPDAILSTIFGKFLDEYPGEDGYKLIFVSLLGIAIIGIICSVLLFNKVRTIHKESLSV